MNDPSVESVTDDSEEDAVLQDQGWRRGCSVEVCVHEAANDWVNGTVEWIHDDGNGNLCFDIRHANGNIDPEVPQRFVRHPPVHGKKKSHKAKTKRAKRTKAAKKKSHNKNSKQDVEHNDGNEEQDMHWTGKLARIRLREARGYNELLGVVCDIGRALDTAMEGGRFLTYKFVLVLWCIWHASYA